MSQSLSQLYVHLTFHIKYTSVPIRKEEATQLYVYIGAILNDLKSTPIIINGVADHIHILCIMSKNIALAKLVEDVKRHSSRWIKKKSDYYASFAWQKGYGGFSVSPSVCARTKQYIMNQEKHHATITFKDEYLLFLKQYGISFNENHLWDD